MRIILHEFAGIYHHIPQFILDIKIRNILCLRLPVAFSDTDRANKKGESNRRLKVNGGRMLSTNVRMSFRIATVSALADSKDSQRGSYVQTHYHLFRRHVEPP